MNRRHSIAYRQCSNFAPNTIEIGVRTEDDCTRPLFQNLSKSSVDFADCACPKDLNSDSELHLSIPRALAYCRLDIWIGRVHEHSDHCGVWHEFPCKLDAFWDKLARHIEYACNVAAWPVETGDKTNTNRVYAYLEYDWQRVGCL